MSCFSNLWNQLKWCKIDCAYKDERNPEDTRWLKVFKIHGIEVKSGVPHITQKTISPLFYLPYILGAFINFPMNYIYDKITLWYTLAPIWLSHLLYTGTQKVLLLSPGFTILLLVKRHCHRVILRGNALYLYNPIHTFIHEIERLMLPLTFLS